jgi:hypothetical protein
MHQISGLVEPAFLRLGIAACWFSASERLCPENGRCGGFGTLEQISKTAISNRPS